ncbi:MAG: hypothetical protein ACYC4U_22120 [Pirellulaceae bacterium]
MTRRSREQAAAPGQDAFLDVVCNLVGIMIILVMIVGTRVKGAMLPAEHAPEPVSAVDIESPRNAAVAVRHELETMLASRQRQEIEIAYRRNERDRILTLITTAEKALAVETDKLSEEQRGAHELQLSLSAALRQQEDLKKAREAVEQTEATVAVLQHRPTPLAKTVFGKEIHFRLQAGRIVYVPIDELVEMFQSQAKEKAWKLKQAPRITETVGPYRGFHLRYTLRRGSYTVDTRGGRVEQSLVELEHFILLPVQEQMGETIEQALHAESDLRTILAGFHPDQATVTVWVYPDSFEAFRLLKEELYKLGFLTASRPMPADQPISGSPQGTRSAVE